MPTDDDTVPVRRETLRVLKGAAEMALRDSMWLDDWRDVQLAVREAEAQLRGEESA